MDHKCLIVIWEAHDSQGGGHYRGKVTLWKMLHIRLWWLILFIDAT
jgi:hypothetical protein